MSKSENPRTKLARFLTGFWEYECHIDPHSLPFDGGEVGRGGRINIKAEDVELCVEASANAFRLWTVRKLSDGLEKKEPLAYPIHWETTHGGLWVAGGKILFSYTAHDNDGKGMTSDTYALNADSMTIETGRFEHRRRDGQEVTGSVQLFPMASADSFTLAPRGCIVPPVAIVSEKAPLRSRSEGGEKAAPVSSGSATVRNVRGNVTIVTGSNSSANQHLNDASIKIKSIDNADVRNVIDAVLGDAAREESLTPKQRELVADAVKDLVEEIRSPNGDNARAMKWVETIKVHLPMAASVVELASKVKSLVT